jgi:Global regulator protein family.
MLTLTRRNRGEQDPKSQIVIRCACGETVIVTVVHSSACDSKLAFDAAKTVSIMRRELLMGQEKPCKPPETA